MESEKEVTQADMLELMRQALDVPVIYDGEAYTKRELAELWNLARSTAGRRVEDALEAGLVVEVHVRRSRKHNRPQIVKAYRIKG